MNDPAEHLAAVAIPPVPLSGGTSKTTVPVWDLVVRVGHWGLVAGFLVALLSEEGKNTHQIAGYTVAAIVVVRLAWGFIGPAHARFANFVPTPRHLFAHLADVFHRREHRELGHNPAAGAMVAALLGLMLLLGLTGFLLTTDGLRHSVFLAGLHGTAANVALVLVVIHVAGAIYESVRFHENLPWSMVTGRKRV